MPLFENLIPGFSVEEHTPAADWWTDDPATDPWAWRQVLASNARVAYGKFFDRKAGFVSRAWFPVFANYRRDGYDYEGMYEDGKMNSRCKRILDVLEIDEDARRDRSSYPATSEKSGVGERLWKGADRSADAYFSA